MIKPILPKGLSKVPISVWAILPLVLALAIGGYYLYKYKTANTSLIAHDAEVQAELTVLKDRITTLESEDQRVKNKTLADLIAQIKTVYKKSVAVYESLVDLRAISKSTAKFDDAYANAISLLVAEDYKGGDSKLTQLSKDIAAENAKVVAASVPAAGKASGAQIVHSDIGDFSVSLVTADLGSTRVIVDTASDGDCGNSCPVMSLAAYAARSGAYAGINGSYFCPAAYPTCAGKTNSFDLLVMNKNKHYINSDNNIYSTNPAVIFNGGSIRFVSAVSQWGRDTGIDGMLSNYPLTVFNSNVNFGGNDDPKQGSKGNRSFVGNKGNTVYIGVVFNATVAESAHVLKSLGLDNALNLDSGGSTALYNGGYKVGPGRDIPNAILFVKK